MTAEFLGCTCKLAKQTACARGGDGYNVSLCVVFAAATPGLKVERIKVIVKCPSHRPHLSCPVKTEGPKACIAFIVIIHTVSIDYGMHWLR